MSSNKIAAAVVATSLAATMGFAYYSGGVFKGGATSEEGLVQIPADGIAVTIEAPEAGNVADLFTPIDSNKSIENPASTTGEIDLNRPLGTIIGNTPAGNLEQAAEDRTNWPGYPGNEKEIRDDEAPESDSPILDWLDKTLPDIINPFEKYIYNPEKNYPADLPGTTYHQKVYRPCRFHGNGAMLLSSGDKVEEWDATVTYDIEYVYSGGNRYVISCNISIPGWGSLGKMIYPDEYLGWSMPQADWNFVGWSDSPQTVAKKSASYDASEDRYTGALLTALGYTAVQDPLEGRSAEPVTLGKTDTLHLYAMYEPIFSVRYEIDGNGAGNYEYGGETRVVGPLFTEFVIDYEPDPEPAAATGYVFTGWSETPGRDRGDYRVGDIEIITAPLVLHACWMTFEDYRIFLNEQEKRLYDLDESHSVTEGSEKAVSQEAAEN